jgi:hypothetical protein
LVVTETHLVLVELRGETYWFRKCQEGHWYSWTLEQLKQGVEHFQGSLANSCSAFPPRWLLSLLLWIDWFLTLCKKYHSHSHFLSSIPHNIIHHWWWISLCFLWWQVKNYQGRLWLSQTGDAANLWTNLIFSVGDTAI